MKKILTVLTIFIFSLAVYSAPSANGNVNRNGNSLQADADYMIYHGKKLPSENSSGFRLLEVRTSFSDGKTSVSLLFTSQINPSSVSSSCFSLNGRTLSGLHYKFSKDGMNLQLTLPNEEIKTLLIRNIQSYNGSKMRDETFSRLEKNARYRYSKESHQWKKF